MEIFEIIGVAGSGKTTLRSSIISSSDFVLERPSLRRISLFPVWSYAITRAFVCCFSKRIKSRSIPQHMEKFRASYHYKFMELRTVASLIVMLHVLETERDSRRKVILFDQGPIYQIAVLHVLGAVSERTGVCHLTSLYLDKLKKIYSGILYLNATDAILERRRKNREDWAKYIDVMGTEENIKAHLADYHNVYEMLIKTFEKDGTEILVKHTDRSMLTQISNEVICWMKCFL